MNTTDKAFAERVLVEAASPRVAAECFVQDAESAGVPLTELQSDVLLVLRYDDILQVHGIAAVLEEMSPELRKLADALERFDCGNHAHELNSIAEKLDSEGSRDDAAIERLLREHGDFDEITLKLVREPITVRSRVLESLRAVRS